MDERQKFLMTLEDRQLLRRVQRHTHICSGCFGMWKLDPKMSVCDPGLGCVLNREALKELLKKPRDRCVFERHRGTWYHAKCWKWLVKFEAQMRAIDRQGKNR